MDKNRIDKQKERENKVLFALVKDDTTHRFFDRGENNSRKGPGDKTGASYAFDIYDFANGRYHYII